MSVFSAEYEHFFVIISAVDKLKSMKLVENMAIRGAGLSTGRVGGTGMKSLNPVALATADLIKNVCAILVNRFCGSIRRRGRIESGKFT